MSVRVLRWRTSPAAWPKGVSAGCGLEVSSRASLEECKVWRIRSMATARWRPSTSPALFFLEGWRSQKISPLRACGLMALYSGCAVGGVVNVAPAADAVWPARRIVASGLRHLTSPTRHQSRSRSNMGRTKAPSDTVAPTCRNLLPLLRLMPKQTCRAASAVELLCVLKLQEPECFLLQP